jgi:hypothetical protein
MLTRLLVHARIHPAFTKAGCSVRMLRALGFFSQLL